MMRRSSAETCVAVPVVYARKAYATLRTLKLLDLSLKPVVHQQRVFFPLKSDDVPSSLLSKFNAEIASPPFPLPRRVIRVPSLRELREKTKLEIPQSLTLVGDIAIIGLITAPRDEWDSIGRAILEHYPVRAVFLREGETSGVFRIPRWRRLAGWGRPETIHVESGVWYYIDFERAFFNPRMQGERTRVESCVRPEERVLDMFSGIGGFTLRLARKCCEVYAIDINPNAISLLSLNIELNEVPKEKIRVICGDAAEVAPTLGAKFDRIVMDFPAGALRFLDAALSVAHRGTVIHIYVFEKGETRREVEEKVLNAVTNILHERPFRVLRLKAQREVGTKRYLVSVDLEVT